MTGRVSGDTGAEDRLGEVLGEYLEALEAGEAPSLAELQERHPELASELVFFFAEQERFALLLAPLREAAEAARGEERTGDDLVATMPSLASRQTGEGHGEGAPPGPGDTAAIPPPPGRGGDGGGGEGGGDDDGGAGEPRPPGTRVRYFGDYELLRELGRGGMGIVFRARQISLNRPVALKMLKSDALATEDELRRFQNEAEAVALLDHPHIVPIFEVGEHEGHRYFSMKLIGGSSLDRKLDGYSSDPRAAARLVAAVAEAVHHAHQRGILHRDLKPANILLDDRGQPHVTDFGLAKRVEGDSELTQSGAILGTPAYMSPEQTWGRRGAVTTASDVYGLGAVLYALLAGRAPFGGDTVIDTIRKVRERAPEPVSKHNHRAPGDLEVICLKCLEKDPERRYASAQALADDLRRYLAGEPITARRITSFERAWLWCRRNPRLAAAMGSTAAAVVAVAVIATVAAVAQTRARNRIKGLADDLQSSLNRSERLAGDLKTSLTESYRRLARLDFERAQNAFEKEQIGPRLLRLVQSWRSAIAAGDPGWQHAARASLSAWRPQLAEPRIVLHHEGLVTSIAFSPDGKAVLTGSYDNTARLWDAATGRAIGAPMRHQSRIYIVAFSPDGRAVLTGSGDDTARLWDATTGRPLTRPLRHDGMVVCAAFSPDGKTVLTGSRDQTARLWDAASGQPVGSPMRHQRLVTAVAFRPDGRSILSGSEDHTARLWDAATGRPIRPPMPHPHCVVHVAFSPDGRSALTGCQDGAARLWDAATGRPIASSMRHNGAVIRVAFSPDGRSILTASHDHTARLWDATTGQPISPPMPHPGEVLRVAFSPDGRSVLTGCLDGAARLWDATTGQPLGLPMPHQAELQAVAFSPDGKTVLTGSSDGTARLWDVAFEQPAGLPLQHHAAVVAVVFSPDGRSVLTGSADYTARLWDAATGRPIGSPMRHQNYVWAAAFSPDGRSVLTGSADNTARLWDAASGQPISPPLQHRGGVPVAAFSPDGRSVLTASADHTARLWDAATGRPIGSPMRHQNHVLAVAFSPDGRSVLTASDDNTARLWDATSGQSIASPMRHNGQVICAAFSPDGRSVLTGSSDHTARLWDATTGRPLGPALRHGFALWSAAFSPDGKTVLTGSYDGTARLWDAATGRPLGPPLRHGAWVRKVVFSPDGRSVLTGCIDRTARLWDLPELPDEPERVSAWVTRATALELDGSDEVVLLGQDALDKSRERLESLGGAPSRGPRRFPDPILYGADPSARARALIQRGRMEEAVAAFDEALRARPLYAPLWAERARFHAADGRPDRAIDDAAHAALVCWNDPGLAALARGDAAFRDEALDEILRMQSVGCRPGPEVWRGRGRRLAARGDWDGAIRAFAAPATPIASLPAPDLLAQACLLRLAGDDEGTKRFALEVRGLPEQLPGFGTDGTPIPIANIQMPLWVRLLDDPPVNPVDLVGRAERYVAKGRGEERYVLGAALLRAGRLDEAIRRFEESLAVEPEWPNSGMNAYGLALAHHRLGQPDQARRWLERAESWLNRLDRTYAAEAPGILTGQPLVPVTFEFWGYAQVLRREAAGPILDEGFPSDPFAR
jgi:WD40 repeat protein/tetratricopeptide (TPR) repeat protein